MILQLKKFYYDCLSLLSFNKAKAKQFRRTKADELTKQEVKKIKWGVSYSVFNGEELLEVSLNSIRSEVDYINVVYQDISWYGDKNNVDLLPLLEELKNKGLIDEIIHFTPNLKFHPQKNERKKRTLGLKHAYKAGCKYFMTMDVDEFYKKEQLQVAKYYIIYNNISHSYCAIINYGLLPTRQSKLPCKFSVQFFSKINCLSRTVKSKHTIATVDPSRMISTCFFSKHFFLQNVFMHHMTSVRKDIAKKYYNSSGGRQIMEKVEVDEQDYFTVENIFNIDLDDFESTK